MLAQNKDYVDLSRPTVEGLAYALRHKEIWPKGFSWNFFDCQKCATGLAWALWAEQLGGPTSVDVLIALGLAQDDSEAINSEERNMFFDIVKVDGYPRMPEPADIAERLEALLA